MIDEGGRTHVVTAVMTKSAGMQLGHKTELVDRRWIYYLLHSQRATALKLTLYRRGDSRIVVINIPWYLKY